MYLYGATARFWWLRGHAPEYARLGDDLVAGSKDMPPHQQAIALIQAGSAFAANGDLARGRQLAEQSLALYKQDNEQLAGSVTMNALVLAALGHLAGLRHDYGEAGKLLDEGQALLREFRDEDLAGYDRLQYRLARALVDNFLGQIRLSQDNNDAAAQLFTDGLAIARRAQDWISLLVSLYDLALARQAQGDPAGAAGHLQEGLALAAEAGDESSAAYYLEVLASVAGQRDDPQRAVRLFAAARAILDASGSGWLHAFGIRTPASVTSAAACVRCTAVAGQASGPSTEQVAARRRPRRRRHLWRAALAG